MKKILVIALCVLGICNASGMVREIILTEFYSIIPVDDPDDEGRGGGPDPNLFQASINGNQLSIGAYTDMPAYVEVIGEETGDVIVEEEFVYAIKLLSIK